VRLFDILTGDAMVPGGREETDTNATDDTQARASSERYRMLFELESDAIVLVDNDSGRILESNAAASQLYGYTPDELRQMHNHDLSAEPADTRRVTQTSRVESGIVTVPLRFHKKKDGTVFPTEIRGRFFEDDGRSVHLAAIRDVTARWQAERALQESEERFRTILEHAPDAVYVQVGGLFAYVNAAAVRLLGAASPLEVVGQPILDRVHPDYQDRVRERIQQTQDDRQPVPPLEQEYLRFDSGSVAVEVSATPITYLGKPASLVFARDISRLKRLEAELAQAQKLDSIGQIAGGIAHDFNNMLNVIGGYTELALTRLRSDDPLRTQLLEVKHATDRAADLTRQLLAFSRRQTSAPKLIDLSQHVMASEGMMRRLLGEAVTLRVQTATLPAFVRIDPAQLDQVLVNLLSNARDATSGAGAVHVETNTVTVDPAQDAGFGECEPGAYVEFSVTDNGCGMDDATRERIFEPFFTTKSGCGSAGLGLAVVSGVVKQHQGCLTVSSAPGRGSTFRLYLPLQEAAQLPGFKSAPALPYSGLGYEVVLVVEDEDQVRRLVVTALERSGYRVLQAATPEAALEVVEQTAGAIDLLLTDVIMPGMDGAELQRRLLRLRPGIRTLFMSGYTASIMGDHGILEDGVYFIQKPFSVVDLTRKVRELLDRPA
jgi:PAS domain S-box-containing protein